MIESGNIIDGSNSLSYEELFFKMLSKVNYYFKVLKRFKLGQNYNNNNWSIII